LDNLVFVGNCNLQRLDGPVRGNGQIIQELEAVFRGVGWNVIKVIWGSEWDQLLARDDQGLLVQRMGEVVDGEYQKYTVAGGGYVRNHFWGVDPRLLRMVDDISDDELWRMRLGGHDPLKVHAAYRAAIDHRGAPTVILARTIKGYGLGEAGEGRNITHQQKELNEQELMQFRDRFAIPLSDDEVVGAPLYRPSRDSREATYISTRKEALGGHVPERRSPRSNLTAPPDETFSEFLEGTGDREASTTMGIVRMLSRLMRDRELGERIVPIVPDESRTFGMEGMFREFGIYASAGQLYEPVDSDRLLFYKESRDGQILEEGITEAGAMSSFIAGGMSYSSLQVPTIPFFIFYSMFGLQRFGDLAYAAGDSRARGFLIGATAGRTTLNGEGLQHQDGHSHLLASTIPNLIAYDPAYAYEIAVIVQDGIRRMHDEDESIFYYITVENEPYIQPPMPESEVVREGILRGIYPLVPSEAPQVRLLGSGPILNEVRAAQQILRDDFDIRADVWSVTSYTELRREALHTDRWNRFHPLEEPRRCWLETSLGQSDAPIVAASDYTASLPDLVARWLPGPLTALGTDGFGRSDTREALRDFFEVDANHIVWSALSTLNRRDEIDGDTLLKARDELGIDPNRPDPMMS
ncbi:MAG: pyruvate dehydrogenase (acetyl-transferring), homodimeric type, partial [Chloroflexi bacterium]|nr:pyruvate dehydrogenase (acetyl-transferring), homodimeric type [Chloroflexota bacterium]